MSAVSIIVMFFHLILSLNVIGIQIQNMCIILDKYVSEGEFSITILGSNNENLVPSLCFKY